MICIGVLFSGYSLGGKEDLNSISVVSSIRETFEKLQLCRFCHAFRINNRKFKGFIVAKKIEIHRQTRSAKEKKWIPGDLVQIFGIKFANDRVKLGPIKYKMRFFSICFQYLNLYKSSAK